jgi:hypothetical protein
MFAPDSLVSFRHATFEQIASLEFQKVDFTDVSLDGAVAGPPDVVAAFSSATTSNTFDVFLSHSSEDKDTFVRPLVAALRTMGQRVWYDEQGISIGGSLRQSIDAGLARSHYGVVIFSPSFFARPWTQYELDAFVAAPGRVLPIWFNVGRDDVAKHSKDWADILALKAQDYPIDRLAAALVKAMKPSEHVGALETEKKQLQAELRKLRDENRRLRLENQSLQVGTPTFVSAAASAD